MQVQLVNTSGSPIKFEEGRMRYTLSGEYKRIGEEEKDIVVETDVCCPTNFEKITPGDTVQNAGHTPDFLSPDSAETNTSTNRKWQSNISISENNTPCKVFE